MRDERTERIAQPRRRAGWVQGALSWDGSPAQVNLAQTHSINRHHSSTKDGGPRFACLFFASGLEGPDERAGISLRMTEDLLAQLNEEGLGG